MEIVQTHQEYNPRGIYFGESPDPQARAFVQGQEQSIRSNEQRFHEFITTAPNLNDTYEEELASVHDMFAAAGLDIAPIIVLDQENFVAALTTANETTSDFAGAYFGGYALVCEHPDTGVRELLGKDLVLGNAIHEAAHSTARSEAKTIISSKVTPGLGKVVLNRVVSSNVHLGFVKPRREDMEIVSDGNYWEESFADLTRVRFLGELGREPKADDEEIVDDRLKVKYAGRGVDAPLPKDGDEMITVPVRFAQCTAKIEGQDASILLSAPNGIAAYGLDLLDKEVPGLYETVQASRGDHTKQRDVIQMIDSVKPGLYRELRVLPYSIEGFRQGVIKIGEAIRDRRVQSQPANEQEAPAPKLL